MLLTDKEKDFMQQWVKTLEQDAARWRYWRSLYDIDSKAEQDVSRAIERASSPEQLDAAVDEAMTKDKS